MFRLLYNIFLPFLALFATPFWLWKTHKRGGLTTRLLEKIARYDANSPQETNSQRRPIYLHAVSVGEVNIARKLISQWTLMHPEERFLLAVGTSTGFDLANQSPPPRTEVLYAPLDLSLILKEFFDRYRPSLIVLIEHEVWPNLLHHATKRKIPVALANARLSQRSGRRLQKLRPLLGPTYEILAWVGAQSTDDAPRLAAIGIREQALSIVGSVKFDPALETPSTPSTDPTSLMATLGEGPVLMSLSTFAGEEILFAKAAAKVPGCRIVIIPRHMERREEITHELNEAGFTTVLRSTGETRTTVNSKTKILVIDSTGEMPAFTKKASVAFIGKTLFSQGGQNPCEAIAAKVPVVAGPHFGNFEPLVSELQKVTGIQIINNETELTQTLTTLIKNPQLRDKQIKAASLMLETHREATKKTVESLARLLKLA